MTTLENRLKKFEGYGYKLYKFYDNQDNASAEIPDILCYLYDISYDLNNQLHDLAYKRAHNIESGVVAEYAFKQAKAGIDFAHEWIDKLTTAGTYYLLRDYDYNYEMAIKVIDKTEVEVYASCMNNGIPELKPIGTKISVYCVPTEDDRMLCVTEDNPSIDNKPVILNPSYLKSGCLYAGMHLPNLLARTRVCEKCGKWFSLAPYAIEEYSRRHASLPTTCNLCTRRDFLNRGCST